MFGSETLDAVVGLVFLFLLLSLVCSSIREAFETVLHHRARGLEIGIREIFGDPGGTRLAAEFYKHPLIYALFRGSYRPGAKHLPPYIPQRTFALAVMDLFRPATSHELTGAAGSTALPESELQPNAAPNVLIELRSAIALAENSTIKGALLPLIDAAGNDAVRVRQNIEDWYDSAMDRVSGWYKRRTQIILACIGLAMAVLMNVDSLAIARYLHTYQTARSALVSRLSSGAQIPNPSTTDLTDPVGWLERQGGIPLGWRFSPEDGQTQQDFAQDWRRPPSTAVGWFLKSIGILFTVFAITLGAPFWFDVLNKFMIVRATVKPQEKSPEEPSKA